MYPSKNCLWEKVVSVWFDFVSKIRSVKKKVEGCSVIFLECKNLHNNVITN